MYNISGFKRIPKKNILTSRSEIIIILVKILFLLNSYSTRLSNITSNKPQTTPLNVEK